MATTILIDSRQHDVPLWRDVRDDFERLGHLTLTNKLPAGDYTRLDMPLKAVDTKMGFSEMVKNFCSKDRDRVKREIGLAQKHGIELIFLIVDETATCIEDARDWINLHGSVSGMTLFKTLDTFTKRYGVRFEFCKPQETAATILELLEVRDDAG